MAAHTCDTTILFVDQLHFKSNHLLNPIVIVHSTIALKSSRDMRSENVLDKKSGPGAIRQPQWR